jgi:phage terminase small subunit
MSTAIDHPGAGTPRAKHQPKYSQSRGKTVIAEADPSGKPGKRARAATGPGAKYGLTLGQYEFCLQYLTNGFNASAAYRVAHPNCKSEKASRVEGSRTLALPSVKSYLAERLADHWGAEHMSGDEALARVARHARADIRVLYNAKGELLPVSQWPDAIAGSVKSIKDGPYGKTITLESPLAAQRVILEVTGKLAGTADALDDLTAALKETLLKNKVAGA